MKKNNQLFLTTGIAVALAGITAATALPRPTLADTTAAIASGTAYGGLGGQNSAGNGGAGGSATTICSITARKISAAKPAHTQRRARA